MKDSSHSFVTGGSGFLGGELLERLREQGQHVRALARSERASARIQGRGAEVVRGDLSTREVLIEGMRGCSVVYHCAAAVGDWRGFTESWETNVIGTDVVLDSARAAGVECVVYVSSEQVVSDGGPLRGIDETHPYPNKCFGNYAITKAEGERRALAADGEGLRVVSVRPRLIWGVGDTTVLPRMLDAVRSGTFAWIGGGGYRTSTCHVTNAVEGLLCAAASGRGGESYFVTDGEDLEFRDFASRLLATHDVTAPGRSVPLWLLWGAARAMESGWRWLPLRGAPPVTRVGLAVVGQEVTVRDTKARRELGYDNRVTLEEGLEAMRAARPRSS